MADVHTQPNFKTVLICGKKDDQVSQLSKHNLIEPTSPALAISQIKYIHHHYKPLPLAHPKWSIIFPVNSLCGTDVAKIISTWDTLMMVHSQHAISPFFGRGDWVHNIQS